MNNRDIEKISRDVLQQVKQSSSRPQVATLLELLNPKIISQALGIHYEEHPTIPHSFGSQRKIGGLVDRQAGKIAVSMEFPIETMRFTAAHEIGHWVLHPNEVVMHRDMPVDTHFSESRKPKSRVEREADHFAACLLMPRKLVQQEFEARFGAAPLRFTESIAFALCPHDPESLLDLPAESMLRELALASHTGFGRAQFPSLTECFRVSRTALAIRLKELGLISWP